MERSKRERRSKKGLGLFEGGSSGDSSDEVGESFGGDSFGGEMEEGERATGDLGKSLEGEENEEGVEIGGGREGGRKNLLWI